MKNFLKMTLATITGLIITGILFFIIMLTVISGMAAAGKKPAVIPEKSVLVLETQSMIPDRTEPNPFAMFDPLSMTFSQIAGLNDILKNLRKAADDGHISGVLIENGVMASGWATADEIRNALNEFKKSGKFIYAYSDYVMTQEAYFLSTASDHVWINPTSMFDFKGLATEVTFYREALEKLGVEVQVIRHGKFKGAVEPYLLYKLSDENRLQISEYIGSVWKHVVDVISESRNIPEKRIMELADSLAGYKPELLESAGIIDGMIYRDQLEDSIRTSAGIEHDKKINYVSMTKYSKVPAKHTGGVLKQKIAVIFAEGNIVMGDGNETNIGGNSYAAELRDVRLDSTIKAVVFRVNSRGGDAMASDMIWHEVELTAKIKPVVVSMGNYAASGGYYISAGATKILASPETITGSIGVFGLIPNAGTFLDKKLGINTDVVSTNAHADAPSVTRPLTPFERETIQASVERTYSTFTGVVARGRGMRQAAVDSIGQGHVWSGTDASDIGLVDAFGGLNDAIREAASLAGLESYRVVERPETVDIYSRLIKGMTEEMRTKTVIRELGPAAKYYNELKEIMSSGGIQALMPYHLDVY
jgi:protease-4